MKFNAFLIKNSYTVLNMSPDSDKPVHINIMLHAYMLWLSPVMWCDHVGQNLQGLPPCKTEVKRLNFVNTPYSKIKRMVMWKCSTQQTYNLAKYIYMQKDLHVLLITYYIT